MKKLLPLAFATLCQGVGIGILIPILTHYVLSLGASYAVSPLIFSTFSLMAFFSSIIWGKVSDKFGIKKVLLLSAIGTFISYLWLYFAGSLWELFASRALAGLFAGWTVAAFAMVTDYTTLKTRARGMGLIGAFFGFGFILGPGLGGWIVSNLSYANAGLGSAFFSSISIVIAFFLIRPPKSHKVEHRKSISTLLKIPEVSKILTIAFFTSVVFTSVEGTYALYIYRVFNATAQDVGYVLVLTGIFHIGFQGGVAHRLISRFGELVVMLISIFILILSLITLMYIELFTMYMPILIAGIAMGLMTPSITSYSSKRVSANLKGSIQGALQSFQSLARVIGPAASGYLMVNLSISSPYLIGVFVLSIPIFFIYLLISLSKTKKLTK